LLSTAECSTVLNAEGEVAHDEQTHRIKVYDGTGIRSVVTDVDVDDTPANGADTDPISSNWAYDHLALLTTAGDIIYATGAGVWARLPKGTTGYFLRAAASAPEWATGTTVPNYGAGNVLLHTSATNSSSFSATYVKAKELYIPGAGTLRIAFDLVPGTTSAAYGRIYQNGVAVGTERSVAGGGAETNFSEDIAGWVAADLLQIYIHRGATAEAVSVNDLKIYSSSAGYDILTAQDVI